MQAEIAVQKYAELYDLSPSGYYTLSRDGVILELNLSGANMLGKERPVLKNRPFGLFVSNETKPGFHLFLENIFNSILMSNLKASELLGLDEDQMKRKVAIDPNWKFIDELYHSLPLEKYPVNQIIKNKHSIHNFLFFLP
ncbi:MAG: hypothetical protein Q8N05_12110 [Bacteroidota bacterium]|nr:hypothetical protein [Bacteroidota bacterium]